MSEKSLRFEQWVPRPVTEVFDFFSDAKNLELITPTWLKFNILRMSTTEIRAGTLIDYRLSLHGIPLSWRTLIESWETNRSFVDTQVRGPFSLWHHTHEFFAKDDGTLIVDTLRYRLPMGIFGEIFGGWMVSRDVKAIFLYRKQVIEEQLGKR
jgi:ligand-binding SRPBCC domain-containing protein